MVTVPRRFGVLRFLSAIFKVLAWIGLVLHVVAAVVLAVAAPLLRSSLLEMGLRPGPLLLGPAGVIAVGLGLLVEGVIWFLILYAVAEQILVQLAIEENTRMTAALLLRQDLEMRNAQVDEHYRFG